ncbi:MAG: hypothetical protein ABRQ26_12490 [Syntrophomonadaceae bacterium]
MMIKSDYVIRSMNRSDLDIAVDWAAAEGWNPGLNDAECFYTSAVSFHLASYRGYPRDWNRMN